MTFLAPLFLIGLLAGTIPVVLHMIHRRRAKELPFPTLRFLRISVEKTRRRRRIQDLLLLVLRTVALVLLAVGLARPTITSLGALRGAGSRSAVVVVLDNSASMATIDPDRPRLETARAAARQVLDQLEDGDQVALLITCGPPPAEKDRLQRTQERIRQRLAGARASYQRADLGTKIDEARALLAKTDTANKQIYVITDMQARSWDSLGATGVSPVPNPEEHGQDARGTQPPEGDVPVIVVDCHREPKPNVAVQSVRLAATLPIAGLPVKATVELYNASSIARQRYVELFIDGVKRAGSPALALAPGGRIQHEFFFTFHKGGLRRGEVRLVGTDGLELDDRRHFAVAVDRAVSVAIVRSEKHEIPYLDDAFYLQQALAPARSTGSAIRATVLDAAGLAGERLSEYRVVFCVNLPALDPPAAARLRRYVAEGGNLVWICGDRVDPEAYNEMNAAAGGTLLPGKLLEVRSAADDPERDSWNVTFLDGTHPALRELIETTALYESILVYKQVRLDTQGSPDTWVLARLDDGDCLLAQSHLGRGRVVWLGTSCHVDWTNLPLRPIFLPMLLRLTYELAGSTQDERELLCGAPLVLTWHGTAPAPGGVEIQRPSGERIRIGASGSTAGSPDSANHVDADKSGATDEDTPRYTDTYQPGVYVVRPLDAPSTPTVAVSVNIDPEEANSKTIRQEELQRRLGNVPLKVAENPEDLRDVFGELREGYSLWEVFLSMVLLLLVFETFLANRLVPKQKDQRAATSPK